MQRNLVILGSTGSIGRSTLEVATGLADSCRVVGLAAGRRWRELAAQVREFHVPAAAIGDSAAEGEFRAACGNGTAIFAGEQSLVDLVRRGPDADFVLSAVVGAAGLPATLAAVERGLTIGLANKESLVIAGSILMPLARKTGSRVLPVDSEHSAVFQALHSGRAEEVRRIYLTASGGPFRDWSKAQIEEATLEQALRHPTWQMGPKITIDSATLANKALEVIEACWLFDVSPEQVEVLIHPESIVHSMVEFCDGSIIAQLGPPDMRTPIQYALTYPSRRAGLGTTLNWSEVKRLTFDTPDLERFPALKLGYVAARAGGTAGAVFNAANEAAVEAFRDGRMRFGDIPRAIAHVLARHAVQTNPDLETLLASDRWARREVAAWIQQ